MSMVASIPFVVLTLLAVLVAAPAALGLGLAAWVGACRARGGWIAALLGGSVAAGGLWRLGLPGLGLGLAAALPAELPRGWWLPRALLEASGLALVLHVPVALLLESAPLLDAAARSGAELAVLGDRARCGLTCFALTATVCVGLDALAGPEVRA